MGAEIYVLRQANGISIRQTSKQGYFDATAMCQAWGKSFADYARLQTTKEFLEELSLKMGIPILELVRSQHGGAYAGTWVHRLVAYNLAQWCSAAFAVMVSGWIDDWMSGNHPVATDLDRRLITRTLEDHAEKIQSLDKRISRVEKTIRRDPSEKQVKLLASVVFKYYGGMDPALGNSRCVDPVGRRLPHTEVDHWNGLRHDNRITNLWLIHADAHKQKTAGRIFHLEFQLFQSRLKQFVDDGPEQLFLFA